MDWTDWTYWTHRVGRRHDTWTHWKRKLLELIECDIGYIHHGDDRVTGNDVLYHEHGHHGHHAACLHVGHHGRRVLAVPEHFRCGIDHRTDEWHRHIQWKRVSHFNYGNSQLRVYARIHGNEYDIYCLLGIMLSSASTKDNLRDYTASTLTVTGTSPVNLSDCVQGGMAADDKYLYLRLNVGSQSLSGIYAVNMSTGVASQVCQRVNATVSTPNTGLCVSANGTIFFSEADAPYPYIYWYSVGPFTGTLLTPTLLFSSPDETAAYNYCGLNRLSVNPAGTILYMPAGLGNIYKVTWSGGVGTFTILVSNPALGLAVDRGGNLFATGNYGLGIQNLVVTPGGVATTITETFNPLFNYAAYDSDGCPIVANGANAFLYKLKPPSASSTWAQITSTVTSNFKGVTVHQPSRTIYVLESSVPGTLRTFTPKY